MGGDDEPAADSRHRRARQTAGIAPIDAAPDHGRRRLKLGVALALLLPGVACVVIGPLIGRDAQALLQDGVETTATVEQLIVHGSGTAKRHRALLNVTDTTTIRLNTAISPAQAAALKQGQRLTITWLPGAEDVVVLGNAADVRAVAGRGRLATIVGGVLAAIGAVLGLSTFASARRANEQRR